MQTTIVKNPIQFSQAQSDQVAVLINNFYRDISYDEVEEISDDLLQSYISPTQSPKLSDIEDRLYWMKEIQTLLSELNSINQEVKKIHNA
jgi:hypothetical protein